MVGTVLCVDPDDEARGAAATTLRDATDREVVTCADLGAAIEALTPAVDCVVSEFELPDGTGLDLLAAVRETAPDTGFVLFTDADPDDIDTAASRHSITEYVPKGSPDAHRRLADLVVHTVDVRTQTAYPLPDDETARMQALDDYRPVLDGAGASFDRLTTLVAALLDVPIATIGIVDEHEQQYVACYGIDIDALPREEVVCTYAILESGVVTVGDLRADPRFSGNETLRGADLRAYASADITTPDGRVLGTICAFDHVVREWTEADRDHLRLLAAEAMEVLELRRRLHETGAGTQPPPDSEEQAPRTGQRGTTLEGGDGAGGDER